MVFWGRNEGEAMAGHFVGFDYGGEVEMKVGEETPLLKLFELRMRLSFTEAALIEFYADGEEGLYITILLLGLGPYFFTTNARFFSYFHVNLDKSSNLFSLLKWNNSHAICMSKANARHMT